MPHNDIFEPSQSDPYAYDVFVSNSPADRVWVRSELLPRLEQADLRVFDHDKFVIGTPRLVNIEHAVEHSRRTIVVLTPDWFDNEWNAFEELLVRTADPAARRRKLIPLLLKPCELPTALASLDRADFTDKRRWNKEARRLIRDLQDLVPVPFPPAVRKARDLKRWRKWLRYQRRTLRRGALIAFLAWLIVFMLFQLPPFQRRPGWQAEALYAPDAFHLHNTGAGLLVGGRNTRVGCNIFPKGLWQRPLVPDNTWHESDVDDLLCIEGRDPPALSDIVGLGSQLSTPETVYALTSHTGILISTNVGRRFERYAAAPPLAPDNLPALLVISGERDPTLSVAGEKSGLLFYRDGQWRSFDGLSPQGCAGLPALTVRSLLITPSAMLIGSDRGGLWLSDDGGTTCRRVFDPGGRYEFRSLWDMSTATNQRYLILVRDWQIEPGGKLGTWQLLDMCPRPSSCNQGAWQHEPVPVWDATTSVADVLVQRDPAGNDQWYLVTALGQVWQGDLRGGAPRRLPSITRCLFSCEAALAPSGQGATPYLLAADRIYHYAEGPWWRRLWP